MNKTIKHILGTLMGISLVIIILMLYNWGWSDWYYQGEWEQGKDYDKICKGVCKDYKNYEVDSCCNRINCECWNYLRTTPYDCLGYSGLSSISEGLFSLVVLVIIIFLFIVAFVILIKKRNKVSR